MIKKTILLLISAIFLAACSPKYSAPQTPATGQVQGQGGLTIAGFAFSPNSLTVKAGQSVSVTNNDSVPHTVTSDDGASFNTNTINSGASTTFIAPAKAGTYAFHCNIHKSMTGSLIVQ